MFTLLLLGLITATVKSEFMAPLYPYPVDLSSNNSIVAKHWKERIVAELDAYFNDGTQIETLINVGMENLTFSMNLFSVLDDEAEKLHYFHTSPEVATAANGTKVVDENSIYMIASISKLFTVLAGMISLSEEEWHRPLSKVFSQVFDADTAATGIERPNFDEITGWSLATHMSGLPYWILPTFDQLTTATATPGTGGFEPTDFGFPQVDLDTLGACWGLAKGSDEALCSDEQFLSAVSNQYPVFESWRSPEYSNGGMMLLGLTIGAIRNKTLLSILQDSIFDPLNMTSSGGNLAEDPEKVGRGVLGAVPEAWLQDFSYEFGSGGLKTSLTDLTLFAKAIMASALLAPATTRRWLQPSSLTPSHSYAVGAPWEIVRYSHPTTGRITDIYTKSGDAGPHGGIVALIPEYNAGFNVLCEAAVATKSPSMWALFDHIALHLLPALETEAATETMSKYAGTYHASELNSSLTVAVDLSAVPDAAGGLSIVQWTSNGTDMLTNPLMPFVGVTPKLLPTIQDLGGSSEVAFYATSNLQTSSYQAAGTGPFKGAFESNFDWLGISLNTYGGVSVRELVFSIDASGRASKVSPLALKIDLERLE